MGAVKRSLRIHSSLLHDPVGHGVPTARLIVQKRRMNPRDASAAGYADLGVGQVGVQTIGVVQPAIRQDDVVAR